MSKQSKSSNGVIAIVGTHSDFDEQSSYTPFKSHEDLVWFMRSNLSSDKQYIIVLLNTEEFSDKELIERMEKTIEERQLLHFVVIGDKPKEVVTEALNGTKDKARIFKIPNPAKLQFGPVVQQFSRTLYQAVNLC